MCLRVYNQNYELFYAVSPLRRREGRKKETLIVDLVQDVATFHEKLRKTIINDPSIMGAKAGTIYSLDLPGDGRSK
jgi:hypothetical protein